MADKEFDSSILANEIIGTTPRWITRWGITLIFIVFVLLGLALNVIKFPVIRHVKALVVYEKRPMVLSIPENSILEKVFYSDADLVEKGAKIMVLKNASGREYEIDAPVAGCLYWTDKWMPDSFESAGQIIGYIVPEPNERIAKVDMTSTDVTHLRIGQKVVVKIDNATGLYRDMPGYIDYVGPGFSDLHFAVNIKFLPDMRSYLTSGWLPDRMDEIRCEACITIDTARCIRYFFH